MAPIASNIAFSIYLYDFHNIPQIPASTNLINHNQDRVRQIAKQLYWQIAGKGLKYVKYI